MIASIAIGMLVYLITNPYIPINLIHNRAVLRSNFGNSTAMYHVQFTAAGTLNARKAHRCWAPLRCWQSRASSWLALAVRAWSVRRDQSETELIRRATGLLLAFPALWVAVQCITLGTGKPAEFGRFAILPDTFLMIEAVIAIWTFVKRPGIGCRPGLRTVGHHGDSRLALSPWLRSRQLRFHTAIGACPAAVRFE